MGYKLANYLNKNRFFVFVIFIFCLKIILMSLFSSDYQNKLFMRFIFDFLAYFRQGVIINPYELFLAQPELFPYPPGMFFIELCGGVFVSGSNSVIVRNLLFKLPNLLFDCMGLFYLMKMFPEKKKYVAILYFASPIVIYSTYMHGQLDIIPTSMLLASIYYITKGSKERFSAVKFVFFLFGALSTKLHIIAVLPILFLYLQKKVGWRSIFLIIAPVLLLVLIICPFWGNGMLYNVILNNEQSVLTKIIFHYGTVQLYVPIIAILLIYLSAFTISYINRELLDSLCGILFTVFLGLIPPMPGWYVWIVPFLTIFFINTDRDRYVNIWIYIFLNLVYLIYFIFAHQTKYTDLYFVQFSLSFLKIKNADIVNIIFTILTSILFYSAFLMYKFGIASNDFYKNRNVPFTIGIAGDSGSGKSTLLKLIETVFGKKNLIYIEGDGDHRWERGDFRWKQFTHLNPKSNYLYRQASDISALRKGQSVLRVDYDHETGKFTNQYKIKSKPYILLCGLHSLYLPQLRNNLDIKVYLDIDENLRRYWKIQRDIKTRGYSKEKIVEQIEQRIPDAKKYIYPQKNYADLIICYFDENLVDCMKEIDRIQLSLKLTLSASVDLEYMINYIQNYDISVRNDYNMDLKKQTVIFSGEGLAHSDIHFGEIAENMIHNLDEIPHHSLEGLDNLNGIISVIFLILVSKKMQGADSI